MWLKYDKELLCCVTTILLGWCTAGELLPRATQPPFPSHPSCPPLSSYSHPMSLWHLRVTKHCPGPSLPSLEVCSQHESQLSGQATGTQPHSDGSIPSLPAHLLSAGRSQHPPHCSTSLLPCLSPFVIHVLPYQLLLEPLSGATALRLKFEPLGLALKAPVTHCICLSSS